QHTLSEVEGVESHTVLDHKHRRDNQCLCCIFRHQCILRLKLSKFYLQDNRQQHKRILRLPSEGKAQFQLLLQ
ncbi:hypothetical protein PpSQ1_27205, partial [Pseudomonas putida]